MIRLLVFAFAAAWLIGSLAGAFAQQPTSLSLDVVTSGNDPTSPGPIDTCASAQVGEYFTVDVIIQNVKDLLAWELVVMYDPKVLEVAGRQTNLFQAANKGSNVLDLSDATPNADGHYGFRAVDAADPKSPDSGNGVLGRLVFHAKAAGVSTISVGKTDTNGDGTADQGPFLRDTEGQAIDDTNGDGLFDGPSNAAEVRVGQPCEGADAGKSVQKVSAPTAVPPVTPPGAPSARPAAKNGGASNSDTGVIVGAIAGAIVVIGLAAGGIFIWRRRSPPGTTPGP